jgi:LacI family transcriptional regulator
MNPSSLSDRPRRLVRVIGKQELGSGPTIAAGVARYAAEHGRWRFDLEAQDPTRADGLLVLDARGDEAVAAAVGVMTFPAVRVYPPLEPSPLPVVTCDEKAIGRLGAEHLMDCGLRRFAFAGVDFPLSRQREAGFMGWLADQGFTCSTTATQPGGEDRWPLDFHPGLPGFDHWLEAMELPVGIMAWNDRQASFLADACEGMGLAIPDDVALLGVDNNPFRCLTRTTVLSSVEQGRDRLGYEAAALLERLMAGDDPPDGPVRVPPVGVVTRRSTDVLAIDDVDVATAVRWLRDHCLDVSGVEGVEEVVTCSRATLDRRFRKVVGHSMGQELRRARLVRARELVVRSRLTMLDIALRCGFAGLPHFSAAFKEAFGQAPSDYRRQHGGGAMTV